MNRIKTFLDSLGRTTRVLVLALAVTIAGAGITQAATTISTNVSTGGTLAVTGLSSLNLASTTVVSANKAEFGGTATSTFNTDGTVTLSAGLSGTSATFSTTLGVTGKTTLSNSSTTNSANIGGSLWVGGNATTTSAGVLSLQGNLTVGGGITGSTITATNVANSTSTIAVGCIQTNATSSATNVKILFNAVATSTDAGHTINGTSVAGFVLWGYGTCPNL